MVFMSINKCIINVANSRTPLVVSNFGTMKSNATRRGPGYSPLILPYSSSSDTKQRPHQMRRVGSCGGSVSRKQYY